MKYEIRDSKILYLAKMATNVVIVIVGFYIAFYLRYGMDVKERNIEPFITLIPYIAAVSLAFFHIYLYDDNGEASYIENVVASTLALVMIQISTMAMSFFARGFAFPRSIFAISFIVQTIMIAFWKWILVIFYSRYGKENRVFLIGHKAQNRKVAENLLNMRHSGIRVVKEMEPAEFLYEDHIDDIDYICIASDVDETHRIRILEMALSKDKRIFILPSLYEILLSTSKLSKFDDMPVFKVRQLSLNLEQKAMKRLMDLIFVIPGIALAAPLMAIAFILIKIQDSGPVLYKQERLTLGGKKFNLIKFRTMVDNAEEKTGPVLAGMDDPRITKIGRVLRASRIDELPQLFNVIKGDMSFVGPRPEREYFYNEFEKDIPQFKYRMSAKAGITGLGQILGKYTTSPKDKLTYDLLYIYDYSILLDIKIIMRTIKIMLKKSSSDGKA